jgi:hypothetical protein
MKNEDKLITQVINGFQNNKGKASVYCFSTDVIPKLVYSIIIPFCKRHPDKQIFIVVDCYNTRKSIYNYLNSQNVNSDNGYNIRILSVDFIKPQYHYEYMLTLTVGVNDNLLAITKLAKESHFTLAILTKNIMNNEFISNVRNILPSIDTADLDIAIRQDNIYSPVEEHRYGVELFEDDRVIYNKYTDYINTSVSIFGELSNIEKCKKGDEKLGISAAEFRNTIAHENGWREDLDTNVPFMKQIDDIYNPNILFERACTFYTITKQRRDLVSDNSAKLEAIKNICLANLGKQILIISKRGEYAAKVTKYLNEFSDIKCGDYHDCIDDAIAVDDMGVPILVKSGINKGKPRIVGSQAQSTTNERLFNNKTINTLSIKSASNPKLKIAIDVVIFTSPLCDNIIDVKTRFTNITFNGVPTKTYRVYCVGTIESDKMNKEKEVSTIKVINDTENFVGYDENSGDIIL